MDMGTTLPVIASVGAGAALIATASVFGMRKIILMGQFSYHNARLSTMGNPYITREEVLPLLDIRDPNSIMKNIQGDLSFPDGISSFRESDRILMASFHRSIDSMRNGSPKAVQPLVRSFLNMWEVEELKRLMRLVGKREDPLFPVGFLDPGLETQFLRSKDLSQAVEILEGQKVGKAISQLVKGSDVDIEEVDTVLDRYVIDNFFDIDGLPMSCRKGSLAIAHLLADRYNIQLIIRAKLSKWSREDVMSHLYTKGGTIGTSLLDQMVESSTLREAISVMNGTHMEQFFKDSMEKGPAAVEAALERMLLEGSIGLSHSYGSNIGPTIRYLVSQEMELKNIRTIIQGSFAGWDKDRIKSGLILEGGVT